MTASWGSQVVSHTVTSREARGRSWTFRGRAHAPTMRQRLQLPDMLGTRSTHINHGTMSHRASSTSFAIPRAMNHRPAIEAATMQTPLLLQWLWLLPLSSPHRSSQPSTTYHCGDRGQELSWCHEQSTHRPTTSTRHAAAPLCVLHRLLLLP
jgi:hypothetical protein